MKEKRILAKEQIQDKIKRISYEIYEENFDDKSILICGIEKNGSIIVQLQANDYIDWYNNDWYDQTNTTTAWKTASAYMLG